jgi:hypothetical protein
MSPADQPGPSAFAKFNEVLERDPGNEQARQWLKKIDEERTSSATLAKRRKRRGSPSSARERARQELGRRWRKSWNGRRLCKGR